MEIDPKQAERARQQHWRDENRDRYNVLCREWKTKNREAYNLKEKENAARRRAVRRMTAILALGGCCVRCGFDDDRALQFDHKTPLRRRTNNIRRAGTLTAAEYIAVVTGQSHDLQLLCANCHAIKTREDEDGASVVSNRGGG